MNVCWTLRPMPHLMRRPATRPREDRCVLLAAWGLTLALLTGASVAQGVTPAGNLLVSWRVNAQSEAQSQRTGVHDGRVVVDSRRGVVVQGGVTVGQTHTNRTQHTQQSVMVLNGGQARLFFGRSVPMSSWQLAWRAPDSPGGQPQAWLHSQTQWVDLGEGLTVRPRWAGGRSPVMVELEASSRQPVRPGSLSPADMAGGYEPDGQTRRLEVTSTVAVPLGEWTVVARRGDQTQAQRSGTWSTGHLDSSQQELLEIRISLP